MRRDALIGGIVQFVFWTAVVLGSFYVSAKFLEPYLAMMMQAGQGGESADFSALFEEYKSLLGQ